MARKSDNVLAAVDEDLQEICRTARKEYDRIARIPEKFLSEHEWDMRRDSLRRLELIVRVASMDPKEAAVLTLL
jgi:flagellar motility protein MotE (MotC chaperone)